MVSSLCLNMISAQTLRVCREGKPVSTFPDHALALAGSPVTSCVAHRLGGFLRLRHSSDLRACNDLSSAWARLGHHAFVRGGFGSGISHEVAARCSARAFRAA